jgi:hypothetical protein
VWRWSSKSGAPSDSVGYAQTDYEVRKGVAPQVQGYSSSFALTIAGHAKKCPTSTGIVYGDFQYSLQREETQSSASGGAVSRFAKSLAVQFEGHVDDDAMLQRIDVAGTFTPGDGSPARRISTSFSLDSATGQPSWDAMVGAIALTQDLSLAMVIWHAAPIFKDAQVSWLDARSSDCIKFKFDPPTETRSLRPEEQVEVKTTVLAKDGGVVGRATLAATVIDSRGSLTPHDTVSPEAAPATYTYSAPAAPKRPSGFIVAVRKSRAGVGEGKWRALDQGRYEGTFIYSDSVGNESSAVYDALRVTGNLVWKPEQQEPPTQPSFGDMASLILRPVSGDLTIESEGRSKGETGGSCKGHGKRTFSLDSLPRDAIRFLTLEIAEDGRYKLTLVIPDNPDPFPVWAYETTCVFPNLAYTQAVEVRGVPIVLGTQQGQVDAEQNVRGRVSPPIWRGPRQVTGSWNFKKGP